MMVRVVHNKRPAQPEDPNLRTGRTGTKQKGTLHEEAYSGIFLGKVTKWNDPLIVASDEPHPPIELG
jgi:hypothetical protein